MKFSEFLKYKKQNEYRDFLKTLRLLRNTNTGDLISNIEAGKKKNDLYNKIISNNKDIFSKNLESIISNFVSRIDTLKKRVEGQKKIRKFITYFALLELIAIIILIIK